MCLLGLKMATRNVCLTKEQGVVYMWIKRLSTDKQIDVVWRTNVLKESLINNRKILSIGNKGLPNIFFINKKCHRLRHNAIIVE